MKVAFKDESFAFEFVRNLGFMYYGGSDLGEMMATAGQIKEGDFESWFSEWDKRARRLLSRADSSLGAGHLESAREGYLRASTYFRMAEFYLHAIPATRAFSRSPGRRKRLTPKERNSLARSGSRCRFPTKGPRYRDISTRQTIQASRVPHSSSTAVWIRVSKSFSISVTLRPCGAAYNCLTFDGPGQGAPIREQKLYHRYDWEAVVTPAVDYALSRPDVDGGHLALMGMSLGGYFAARAAAFEHRFRAAVFFNGLYSAHQSIPGSMPNEAMAALDKGDPMHCEEITYKAMQTDTNLRWAVTQGVWSFGASGLADYLSTKSKPFTMEGIAEQIPCPCLVLDGEGDILVGGHQAQDMYDALRTPKQIVRFTSEDGAENHCEAGALAYKDEVVFNWLDETLKVHDDSSS